MDARALLSKWVVPLLDLAARVYLGGVFIYAAVGKIADPYAFAVSIATYQIMPLAAVNLMAIVLPWLEVLAGGLLIVGVATRAQALAINGMLVMFMVAIAWALASGVEMTGCGCFASEEAQSDLSGLTLLRDAGWLALGIFAYFADRNRLALDRLLAYCSSRRTRAAGS